MSLDSYYKGTAIRIDIEVKDYDDAYLDPDTITVTVYDPAGSVKLDAQEPSKVDNETGKYYIVVQTLEDWIEGNYIIKPIAEYSGYTALVRPYLFKLIE